jgi:hypothetical protein
MRIISDFKDYYDCVMGMGMDLGTIYLRKKRMVTLDTFPFPRFPCSATQHSEWTVKFNEYIVGFCGEIYPMLEVHHSRFEDPTFCYNVEDVDACVEKHYRAKNIESYYWRAKDKRKWRYFCDWPHKQRRHDVEKFFQACKDWDKHPEFFHRGPIFVARYDGSSEMSITYNDQLPTGFVRMFDPYTAFQEIYMFMCNMAVPLKPIPEVSDADMVVAKGFNKWSFRKEPRKKK